MKDSGGVIWKEHPGRRNSRFETEEVGILEKWKVGVAELELLSVFCQVKFVPENQSAYYSFIKEAALPKKKKERRAELHSVLCDMIASLWAHILFFGFAEIYKNYEEVDLRLYKFDIITVV